MSTDPGSDDIENSARSQDPTQRGCTTTMQYNEFLAKIQERGEYGSREETERVTRIVLAVLGLRLAGGEARDLATQVPDQVSDVLLVESGAGRPLGIEEFLNQIATRLNTGSDEAARWDASAVLSTLADAIDGGELDQLLSLFPTSYAALFGHPELA